MFKDEFYEGSAAVTFRSMGKGCVTYVGVDSRAGDLEYDILSRLYEKRNIPVLNLPYGVTMEYRNGLGIVMNYSDQLYTFIMSEKAVALIGNETVKPTDVFVFKY